MSSNYSDLLQNSLSKQMEQLAELSKLAASSIPQYEVPSVAEKMAEAMEPLLSSYRSIAANLPKHDFSAALNPLAKYAEQIEQQHQALFANGAFSAIEEFKSSLENIVNPLKTNSISAITEFSKTLKQLDFSSLYSAIPELSEDVSEDEFREMVVSGDITEDDIAYEVKAQVTGTEAQNNVEKSDRVKEVLKTIASKLIIWIIMLFFLPISDAVKSEIIQALKIDEFWQKTGIIEWIEDWSENDENAVSDEEGQATLKSHKPTDEPKKKEKLIDLELYPIKEMLPYLLQDKTTKENIILATNTYSADDADIFSTDQITLEFLQKIDLQPRAFKSADEQNERTRAKAEVFTPSWLCNKMNNYCDAEWFGEEGIFNTETEQGWIVNKSPVQFPEGKSWKDYVESKRLEITCGEAPYIASRYDTATGEIIPTSERIGLLDRKIRVVNENTTTEEEWLEWVKIAYQSVYGYEFQGDNLLIARINLLNTFVDYYKERWNKEPLKKDVKAITNIIVWNFWQMDGLTGAIPFRQAVEVTDQIDFFEMIVEEKKENYNCRIYDWEANKSIEFNSLKEGN